MKTVTYKDLPTHVLIKLNLPKQLEVYVPTSAFKFRSSYLTIPQSILPYRVTQDICLKLSYGKHAFSVQEVLALLAGKKIDNLSSPEIEDEYVEDGFTHLYQLVFQPLAKYPNQSRPTTGMIKSVPCFWYNDIIYEEQKKDMEDCLAPMG